jgi:proteasome accessory factor A
MAGEPGEGADTCGALFIENGGAFNYEALGLAPHGGLLEGSTPECTGATELLAYQRAQEALLREALRGARLELAEEGYPGSVSLLKNCRDAYGNLYGAQENYSVEVARGWRLAALRIGLALLLPLHLLFALFCWLLILILVIVALALVPLLVLSMFVAVFVPPLARWLDRLFAADGRDDPDKRDRSRFARPMFLVERFFSLITFTPWALVARAFAIQPIRRQLTGFIVSRPVFTGAGSLLEDDAFRLSEKADGVRHIMRVSTHPDARGIYELPDVLKAAERLVLFKASALARAFRRRQRLQISFSDSNMAQVAEYLKIGTTLVVIGMIEAGVLGDAPLPADPVAALHAINADPTLRVRVSMADGGEMSALEMQRFYLDRAKAHVGSGNVVSMETHEILRIWEQALDALDEDPGQLVGRLDWVTKRLLIEQCADDAPEVKKKIDLRYHELDDGYFRALEAAGGAATIIDERTIERAKKLPPSRSPAARRGRLIAQLADSGTTSSVDWERVRIGGVIRGKVIRLDDYR